MSVEQIKKEGREKRGKLVRDTWIEWAKEQPNPKPSWFVPWEELSDPDKEVDRRIGDALHDDALRGVFQEIKNLTAGDFEEAARVLKWGHIQFGLQAQGKLTYVGVLLAQGKSWEEIGKEIGWCPATAKEFYERETAQLAKKERNAKHG